MLIGVVEVVVMVVVVVIVAMVVITWVLGGGDGHVQVKMVVPGL